MSQASTGLSKHERSGAAVNRKRYADTAEAAAYVKYGVSHFRALVRAGKFTKPIRPNGPGGKCIFDLDVLDDDMSARSVDQGVIPPATA